MNQKTKILITDDHMAFRKGVRLMLNSLRNVEVTGEASNGLEMLHMIKDNMPDVVLMDIRMPGMDGADATVNALQLNPDLKIIVLSMLEEADYINKMLELGVSGYMSKTIDLAELRRGLETVLKDELFFSSAITDVLAEDHIRQQTETDRSDNSAHAKLTKREQEVLVLICEGLTNQEIGDKLLLSPRTAQGFRIKLLRKTGAKNTAMLISYAYKHQLVNP